MNDPSNMSSKNNLYHFLLNSVFDMYICIHFYNICLIHLSQFLAVMCLKGQLNENYPGEGHSNENW